MMFLVLITCAILFISCYICLQVINGTFLKVGKFALAQELSTHTHRIMMATSGENMDKR